jgi:hypothetical protein
MCDLKRTTKLVRELHAWVECERRSQRTAGHVPSRRAQRLLRRARICEYAEEPDFMEALRELAAFEKEIKR